MALFSLPHWTGPNPTVLTTSTFDSIRSAMKATTLELDECVPTKQRGKLRWLPSKQGWRRLVVIATLVAVAWQVENWRGRRTWKAGLQEIEANRQTLDWRTFLPDHLNAAKHSIFADVCRHASGYEPYGYFIDLNILIDCFFLGMPKIRWSDSKAPLTAWYQTHGIDTPQEII